MRLGVAATAAPPVAVGHLVCSHCLPTFPSTRIPAPAPAPPRAFLPMPQPLRSRKGRVETHAGVTLPLLPALPRPPKHPVVIIIPRLGPPAPSTGTRPGPEPTPRVAAERQRAPRARPRQRRVPPGVGAMHPVRHPVPPRPRRPPPVVARPPPLRRPVFLFLRRLVQIDPRISTGRLGLLQKQRQVLVVLCGVPHCSRGPETRKSDRLASSGGSRGQRWRGDAHLGRSRPHDEATRSRTRSSARRRYGGPGHAGCWRGRGG